MAKQKPLLSFGVSNTRVVKELRQTGKFGSKPRDAGRVALKPGKRVSKNGLVYWETRRNRTDDPEHNKGQQI